MKKILTIFTVVLSASFAYSNPITSEAPPTPEAFFGPTHGTGAQATPIDEYTILLFLLGIVIASTLYSYKKNLLVKIK